MTAAVVVTFVLIILIPDLIRVISYLSNKCHNNSNRVKPVNQQQPIELNNHPLSKYDFKEIEKNKNFKMNVDRKVLEYGKKFNSKN